MNNKFFDLPQEKQNTIINAALHVFAKYDYKKASTDEITSLAGISKGLLFHYFENKKGLYLFLYKYAISFFIKEMSSMHDYTETDFFKISYLKHPASVYINGLLSVSYSIHPHIDLAGIELV